VVAPGQTADVSVRLTAPLTTGSYRSNWMLRNPAGALFGIGTEAASAFWVIINVGDTSTGAGPWQGEYFNNRTLSGTPALTRQDAVIDFNWGSAHLRRSSTPTTSPLGGRPISRSRAGPMSSASSSMTGRGSLSTE
jgi:hypothetical protein